ncbi:galectin-8 isoform X2 [Tetranychus urticae]|uniref:galectin-8 isoform X2 n=1 Tax=Tetranychus urticae TaxID=32264 RepID=UPI00077BEE93|nr:galectin-8 isoform X2 [Tetranychus urticae]
MSEICVIYPEPEAVLFSVDIPYSGLLPYPCKPGLLLYIHGRIPENAEKFCVNLAKAGTGDKAFHFNPRFGEQCVVRNSFVDNKWGNEERNPKNHIPFSRGESFNLLILVQSNCYRAAVNGEHFIDFDHRTRFSEVRKLEINGDVVVNKISYHMDNNHTLDCTQFLLGYPIYRPKLPFKCKFPSTVSAGFMVYISGRPELRAHRFAVDLLSGEDIAFHFNVRFDEKAVVRNSFTSGDWLKEERHISYFPFALGVNFDMIILITEQKLMVALNGQHYINYNHQVLPIDSIDSLSIRGDLCLSSIRFST